MKFQVGKLYICSKYYLLLYSTSAATAAARRCAADAAVAAAASAHAGSTLAATWTADYWSKRLGEPVSFCEPGTILLILDKTEDNKYIEVLADNKKGWVIYRDWLELEKLTPSNQRNKGK